MSKKHIEDCVRTSLDSYFRDLRGTEPDGMYEMLVRVVEKPLLDVVMTAIGVECARPGGGDGTCLFRPRAARRPADRPTSGRQATSRASAKTGAPRRAARQ